MNATASPTAGAAPALPLGNASSAPLERAAGALARLDAALDSHPLARAWLYRARLDAVRREAAVDGQLIEPWHLAAVIEGVRFRLTGETPLDRGVTFAAARHAFDLYRWHVHPDEDRQHQILDAAAHLKDASAPHSALVGAALGVHSWLDRGGGRAPMRAALAHYWVECRIARLPLPFSATAALSAETPWTLAAWIGEFLGALAAEAEDGLHLLRVLERDWLAARRAVKGRRRGSHAAAAVDILAAAPVLSATTLAAALGIAPKNAARLLEGFTVLGIVVEVTHRSKRRLYGLKHLAPLREAVAPPLRRALIGRGRGRPGAYDGGTSPEPEPPARIELPPPLPRPEREAFEFDELDRWMAVADLAIRRAQRALEVHAIGGTGRGIVPNTESVEDIKGGKTAN
jgi:hypothetical protein